jgi:hypothetical protein
MRFFSTETRQDRLVNLLLTLPTMIILGSGVCSALVVIVKDLSWSDFRQVFLIVVSVMFIAYLFHFARLLISSKGRI